MKPDARPPLLPDDEVAKGLAALQGWERRGNKIHKAYRFKGFPEAFGFMASCALVAQAMDHHPEWSNVYDRVQVDLTTHDAGGVTALDLKLAAKMDALAAQGAR